MNDYSSTLDKLNIQGKIRNFIYSLEQLTIDDSNDLLSFEGQLIELKNQLEKVNNNIETNMKINMINGILEATTKEAFWYFNMSTKRKTEDEASSSNKNPRKDNLNKHDKRTIVNCIKENIEQKINKNYEYLKTKGIGPSKIAHFLLNKNNNFKKDMNNLEEAIYLGHKWNVD